MKCIANVLFLLFIPVLYAQSYSGPAEGSVPSGVTVSTDEFTRVAPLDAPAERGIRNIEKSQSELRTVYERFTDSKEGDNYFEDPSVINNGKLYDTAMAVLLKSFNGIGQTNSIPPDPYIAAGPTHIIATVNSDFAIWDKEGNLIKTINAGSWFRSVLIEASPFDPKVLYDHFDKRWIMVWLHQSDPNQNGYLLVSVSDDSIPTGTWYNWALPSHQNGSTVVSNWSDYQGVGFDKNALYVTANQWGFGSGFQYVRIRIIPKAQLYNNTAGAAIWKDIWNISYPPNGPFNLVFNIRPSIMYTENDDYYLLHSPNFGNGADFMALYKISNALTTPGLSGSIVPVTTYYPAPNADQLGGSTMLLETGGSHLRNEPRYRDGFLWAVHTIRNPVTPGAAVRYVKINPANSTAVEDVAMGAQNFWYSYPALEIDKDHNLALSFSRSATTEYIGAFYTYRINTDTPGLRGSISLQEGKGNYVKDYSSGRNRWGDYNGLWLDPSDNYSMWAFAEFASATNTWGTWVGKIRLTPFSGIHSQVSVAELDFGNVEINNSSGTLKLYISNYGEDDLIINNIPVSEGSFRLLDNFSYPLTLGTYDSLAFNFTFSPSDTGEHSINYPVVSNDIELNGIPLRGYGYRILPAQNNTIYAVSGAGNNNISFILNRTTGAASILGPSKMKDLESIAVNPKTNIIYGISSDNYIVRVNGEKGDAYNLFDTELEDVFAAAFDTSGQLYIAQRTGDIYSVNLNDNTLTQLSRAKINIYDMAFNPVSNQLWASLFLPVGSGKDRIFKIDILNGDTLLVDRTGFNASSAALTFDINGNLFGVNGSTSQVNSLIQIDTSTGTGTLIGPTGIKDITGLAYSRDMLVDVENEYTEIPSVYNLKQNYPNPFNPTTLIEFSLPEAANVKLTIYNLLGEVIDVLLNSDAKAGIHKINWNTAGKNISSGVYFYEISARNGSGKDFSSIRKMILMK